ncbi:hypothetical protein B1400_0919 [Bifidobacterium italicum]|uniref:Zinc-ribbon domain-containing protein n=1 Tax=Bifidobacterium italicum TaxID=1960968 RepID=A0A2A2EK37_9BIFI|nr:zinc-ribbon domain-containing protein [Bifidobacterium italicum]PAU69357.1 hypothetical protein B1400_0919 [Bifidobacterium italicum]
MRRCTRCGSELNERAKVCPVCGTPVDGERAHLRRMVVAMLVAAVVVAALLVVRSRQLGLGGAGVTSEAAAVAMWAPLH